jgi:hypothetical protein
VVVEVGAAKTVMPVMVKDVVTMEEPKTLDMVKVTVSGVCGLVH